MRSSYFREHPKTGRVHLGRTEYRTLCGLRLCGSFRPERILVGKKICGNCFRIHKKEAGKCDCSNG